MKRFLGYRYVVLYLRVCPIMLIFNYPAWHSYGYVILYFKTFYWKGWKKTDEETYNSNIIL